MIRSIVFSEAAREDVEAARRWYRERSGVLGRDFVRSLRACIEGIESFPESHPMVHRGIRRALFRRFPYMLHYDIRAEAILIVGRWHAHRDPQSWKGRLG